ncbi:MAG: gliding motility-associated C-terminal domain-containing protein [Deltaproteobacteria bacterium]
MKNFILSLFFFILAVSAYGQFADLCGSVATSNLTVFPTTVSGSIPVAYGDEGNYTATSLSGTINTAFYAFTVNASGYYSINFEAPGGAGSASGTLSVGFGTGGCPGAETDAGDITFGAGFNITSNCLNLTAGTTYYISMALEDASAGNFNITISQGGVDVCQGALPVVLGANPMNNSCSQLPPLSVPGTVWSTFTVVAPAPGQNDHIVVNLSVAPGTLINPAIYNVLLNAGGTGNCATAVPLTSPYKCLNAGDVLYIETGNITPAFGTYTLNVTETYQPIANDICTDAIDLGILSCTNTFTQSGNNMACSDIEQTCYLGGTNDYGIWYSFTVSPAVPRFNITGSRFEVFTGSCAALTSIGCAPQNDIIPGAGTTYYVLVYDGGTFTVQSDVNEPANDLCANAIPLTDGIEGYNSCATMTNPVYCGLNAATGHDVYYTYTNNGTNSVNLELTVSGSTATTGLTATQVSVQVYSDCGAVLPGFTAQCNTLGNQFTIECIQPGEDIFIAVGSADGQDGDFSIDLNVVTNPLANNVCSGAVNWGTRPSSCAVQNFTGLNNSNACQDATPPSGACNFNTAGMHGVWYTFTTDANAELIDITTDLGSAVFALFEGPCSSLNYVANSCTTDGTLTDLPIDPNTTYWLLISSTQEDNNFNIDITIKNIPDNNLCADAVALTDGVTVQGTNACADGELSYCTLTPANSHQVYYTYTNNTGGNVDINVTVATSTATTGNAASNVSLGVLTGCPGIFHPVYGDLECGAGLPFTNQDIDCIEDGESLIFVVGSPDGDEGDFTIRVNVFPNNVDNDECVNANEITGWSECEWFNVTGTNVNACPEDFDTGGCGYDQNPVVWLEFTPADDGTVEFDNFSAIGNGFLGLFQSTNNCDNQTAIAGAGCNNEGSDPFGPFNVSGGTTYFIAVGSSGGEGAFSFDIKINKTLNHDDPCAAGYAPQTITGDYTDNNTCATQDFTLCGGALNNTNGKTLFYEYTMTQDADLQITVTGSGGGNAAGGPFYLGIFETVTCGNGTLILEDCDGDVTIPCLEDGQTIIILVGTTNTAGSFGQYNIAIDEQTPVRPNNDACANAEDIEYLDADLCQWVPVENNESNVNACSEDFNVGTCQYSTEEVVWYSITIPSGAAAGADLNVRFLNYNGTGELFATFFDDNCVTYTALSPCFTGDGPHALADVVAGNTYYIAVGSSGDDGGSYEMEVNVTSGPPNDDACADLTAYDLTGGAFLQNQTNACSVGDVVFPECNAGDQTNAVIYQFTISEPQYGIQIRVLANGTDPISGTVVAGISGTDTDFCSGNTYTPPAFCEDISTAIFEFICLEPGTYQVQISSSEANAGTFNIQSTMLNKPVSACNQNDICADAVEIVIDETCEWIDIRQLCNNEACPDLITVGGCDLSQGPTVWYSVVIPDGASTLEVRIDGNTFGNPVLAVFSECPVQNGWCNGTTTLDPIDVSGAAGSTFYIAVSAGDGIGGQFNIYVKIDVPPENDSPCMASDFHPYDLGTNGSHGGSTCCAIGANDDPALDQANVNCNTVTDDNAVWYRAEFAGGTYDGVEINVDGGTVGGNVAVEVYTGGPDAACDGTAHFKASKCNGLPFELRMGCIPDGDYIFIKVTSTDGDCGTFSISIEPVEDCEVADECEDITAAQTLTPITSDDLNYVCTNGCLDLSCPENPLPAGGNGCDFSSTPTVWYYVDTDLLAAQLFTTVTSSSGTWQPIWSVYYGECGNLTNAATGNAPPCSNGDNSPDVHQTGADNAVEGYYVAVTYDPNDPPTDGNTEFEICAATIESIIVCLGDINDNCEPDPTVEIKITERENADAEPDYDPNVGYLGPFCPGEEVTVHIEFHYDATDSGADWLIGFCPDFGPGWDMAGYNYDANPPTGTPSGTGQWHEAGDECAPLAAEHFSFLCTYVDDNGILHICNELCENCSECDQPYLDPLDPIPSGWFWLSNGSNATCVSGSCQPHQRWGIGSTQSDVNWDFPLKVKTFDSQEECEENDDLQITFQTFSDGGAGCWEDPVAECLIDRKQLGPLWKINCEIPPGVIAVPQPKNICTNGEVGITVSTDDGSVNTILVTFEDNPNVSGESDHTFDTGVGVVNDILVLDDPDACDPEVVTYYAQVVIPGMICEGKMDTFEVTVYPLPRIPDQDPVPGYCNADLPAQLQITAECGYPGGYQFSWTDDLSGNTGTGNTINVTSSMGIGLHTFSITVTDELGCSNTGTMQINVYDDVRFALRGDTLCWLEEKEFIPDLFGDDEPSDFTYNWYWEPGMGSGGNGQTFALLEDDYTSFMIPGEHKLCLVLTETHPDGTVCEHDTCVNVWIKKPFIISIDPNPAYICEGQNCVDINLVFDEINGLSLNDVEDICWNGECTNLPFKTFCEISTFTYSVLVSDVFGCDTTLYFDILENPITDLTISGKKMICIGESTTLTVDGDFDSYEWSTGAKTKSITVSPTTNTTYTVSAVNTSGCVSTGEITVEVFKATVPDIPASVSFCTGYSVTFTAPPGYATYTWYFGSTSTAPVSNTATVVINKAGNYILVVTTNIGCSAQNTILAREDNELSPVVFGDFLLCFEEPTGKVWASGGTFTQFQWRYTDKNGNLIPNTTNKDTVNLSDGKYYVWVSDGNCAGDTTFTIIRKPKILPKIIPDVDTIKLCFGETTTLTAPAGFTQYQWNSGQFSQVISNVGKGNYYVTVTDSDGCKGVDSIYVDVYPRLLPKLQDSIRICDNESVWLKPGDFTDYRWFRNNVPLPQYNGRDSIQVSETAIFKVQVFNEIGCFTFDSTMVVKEAPLTPDILGIIDLCDNDMIVLTSSQNYFKYRWTNSDGKVLSTAKTCNFTMTIGKDIEQVTLTVESQNGCTGSITKPVRRYNTPVIKLTSIVIEVCGKNTTAGNTVLDFSTYFLTGNNSQGTWRDVDASGATHNANWTQVNFGNVQYGKTYRYEFTSNNALSPCKNVKDTLFVNVIECICDPWDITPFVDVCNDASSPEVILNTHIVDKNGVKITPPPAGVWTVLNGAANLINGINFVPANAPAKTYVLQYKLTNIGNYCVDTATVTITVQNSVKAGNPLPFSICAGTDVLIRLDSMLVGENPGGVWSETSSVLSTGNAFKAAAGTFTTAGQLAGTYTFRYYLDAVDPCPDADATVTIIIDPVPNADAGPDQTVCFEDKPVKLGTNSVGTNYSWKLKGTSDILANTKDFSVNQSGTYVLRVESGKGCFKEDEVLVTISDKIVVTIIGKTLLRNGESDTLFATFIGRSKTDKLTYKWTKNGVLIQQPNADFIIVSDAGTYCVEISDDLNCTGSDCHDVGVELTKEIEVPNIFTPDGDSKNDKFFVKDGKNVKHIRNIKVFDRWGELVWSDADYSFDSRFDHFWDGIFKGKKALPGVYVYLVEFTWTDGIEDFVAGDVTLVR